MLNPQKIEMYACWHYISNLLIFFDLWTSILTGLKNMDKWVHFKRDF